MHFQGDKKTIYKDVNASIFATNLGGEIVRWSIENIDNDLYKKEPYKRLWILLSNMNKKNLLQRS